MFFASTGKLQQSRFILAQQHSLLEDQWLQRMSTISFVAKCN